jgi:hypothetical protein
MGYRATTYNVSSVLPYVSVFDVIASKVLVVDRNGIGVKVASGFNAGSTTVDVIEFNWYAVKRQGLDTDEYINIISQTITTQRTTVYAIGATIVTGRTYSFYYGNNIAKYTAVAGDTSADVLSDLRDAIIGITWGAFTVTATLLTSTTLEIVISNTGVDFRIYIGQQKWKYGYKCVLNSKEYLISLDVETIAAPTLPIPELTYNFTDLLGISGSMQSYLQEPLSAITYTEFNDGTTEIYGISSSVNVPQGTCVIDEPAQRIYFDSNLGIGERIKVFQQ